MRVSRVGGGGVVRTPLVKFNSPISWMKRDKGSKRKYYSVCAKNYRVSERVNYTEENETTSTELDHVTIFIQFHSNLN